MSVIDLDGKEIKVGCRVAYPVRGGSKMWMNKLRVQQIVEHADGDGAYLCGYNEVGRRITVHNMKNVVLLESAN